MEPNKRGGHKAFERLKSQCGNFKYATGLVRQIVHLHNEDLHKLCIDLNQTPFYIIADLGLLSYHPEKLLNKRVVVDINNLEHIRIKGHSSNANTYSTVNTGFCSVITVLPSSNRMEN